MENGKDPAYPIGAGLLDRCGSLDFSPFGLTKREYFASAAMQGYLSSNEDLTAKDILRFLGLPEDTVYEPLVHYSKYITTWSIRMADELLNQLSK